ncbi:hypothetical protein MUK42_03421 [Musa troglodytarum]|uniref:Uncharacterized protein n=1 Tax=Musa troglodytarum TaxID=320322 RepID=A0A9E7L154_9LILI|nr:hypothetical protein MUK42_03421 [Musa troglodytarum]
MTTCLGYLRVVNFYNSNSGAHHLKRAPDLSTACASDAAGACYVGNNLENQSAKVLALRGNNLQNRCHLASSSTNPFHFQLMRCHLQPIKQKLGKGNHFIDASNYIEIHLVLGELASPSLL